MIHLHRPQQLVCFLHQLQGPCGGRRGGQAGQGGHEGPLSRPHMHAAPDPSRNSPSRVQRAKRPEPALSAVWPVGATEGREEEKVKGKARSEGTEGGAVQGRQKGRALQPPSPRTDAGPSPRLPLMPPAPSPPSPRLMLPTRWVETFLLWMRPEVWCNMTSRAARVSLCGVEGDTKWGSGEPSSPVLF